MKVNVIQFAPCNEAFVRLAAKLIVGRPIGKRPDNNKPCTHQYWKRIVPKMAKQYSLKPDQVRQLIDAYHNYYRNGKRI